MTKSHLILSVAASIALSACGSKEDANEKNFSAALDQYFEKKGRMCMSIGAIPAEVVVADERGNPGPRNKPLEALEAAGILKSQVVEKDSPFGWGKKRQVRDYTFTDAAKPYVQEESDKYRRALASMALKGSVPVNLCWASMKLDKIVKWEGPTKDGAYQEALVHHTYKLVDVAEWAKRPDVLQSFETIGMLNQGAGTKERRHPVKLTSVGWESKQLD